MFYAFLVAFGALHLAWHLTGDDYYNYPSAVELERSVLEHGFYGFDYQFETLYPPGTIYIFAPIALVFGFGRLVFAHSMTLFLVLGLIASYRLIKRESGRPLAAAVCLLLVSSPDILVFSSRYISSELPHLVVSIGCLVLAARLDTEQRLRTKIVLGVLFSLSLAFTLMIRTAGIALLAALVGWLAVSFLQDRKRARTRLLLFLPGLLLGLVVQLAWMRWAARHSQSDWPLPGWPGSYFSQLALRSGNDPELGKATLIDIPARVGRNVLAHAEWLARFLFHKEWKMQLYSPGVAGTVLLIFLGLLRRFWRSYGNLVDWYFVGYEGMLLLWPWDIEYRFLVPIVPIAGIYLWQGGVLLVQFAAQQPLRTAGISAAIAVGLALAAGLHDIKSFVFWLLLAGLSGLVAVAVFRKPTRPARWAALASRTLLTVKGRGLSVAQAGLVIFVAVLCGTGVTAQAEVGRENLHFDPTKDELYPDVLAAQWIQSHTSESDVVMARHWEVVYHFCHRKVVWFPPIGHPDVLMQGIRRHQIAWIVVTDEGDYYFTPNAKDCIGLLQKKYPGQIRLVHEEPECQIYAVDWQK